MDDEDGIEAIEQKRKEIIFQSEKKKSPSLNNRYANFEIDSIINRNPSEELKLIKQRIKNENEKIERIDEEKILSARLSGLNSPKVRSK